jgi:hypothetical protein
MIQTAVAVRERRDLAERRRRRSGAAGGASGLRATAAHQQQEEGRGQSLSQTSTLTF